MKRLHRDRHVRAATGPAASRAGAHVADGRHHQAEEGGGAADGAIATSGAGIAVVSLGEAGRWWRLRRRPSRRRSSAAADHVIQLRHEDQNREGVHEPGHDRTRDEPHELATPSSPKPSWNAPARIVAANRYCTPWSLDQRHHHQRHGAGRGRDHAPASAGEGDDDRDRERGVEADPRVDAGDDRERDRLRDERQRDDQCRRAGRCGGSRTTQLGSWPRSGERVQGRATLRSFGSSWERAWNRSIPGGGSSGRAAHQPDSFTAGGSRENQRLLRCTLPAAGLVPACCDPRHVACRARTEPLTWWVEPTSGAA